MAYRMDRHQMRFALLKVSLVAFAVSTWVFWSFVFSTRPQIAEGDALESLVRLPASLPSQIPGMVPAGPITRANDPISMDVMRIPCWEKVSPSPMETSAHWIRLTGRGCGSAVDAESVSVRNLTNGYMATVFPTQNRTMTTDFIPLEGGANEIQIRFNHVEGATVESQLSVVRENLTR